MVSSLGLNIVEIKIGEINTRGLHATFRGVVQVLLTMVWPAVAGQAVATEQAAPGANPVTQALVGQGVLSCASRINQVTSFLTNGNQSGAMLFGIPGQPDQRMVSVSMELLAPDKTTAYASASFAPNQANGCGAVYEAIIYWPQSCDVVANRQFSQAKKLKVLQKSIQPLESGPAKIFLMPAGSGCVSIKKEVIF